MSINTGRLASASAVVFLTSIAFGQTTYYVNGSCGDDSWTGLSAVCEAPDGPKSTIQAGINAADHFDEVVVADGIYRGAGNKNLEFFTKEMSIRTEGGPEKCIIDCEDDGFGFTFCTLPNDRPVTIEGFTIRNGRGIFAGGICIAAAEVTIDNCIIENCVGTSEGTQTSAGGICVIRSPVLILRTTIRSNQSARYGGGIAAYDSSTVIIEDCHIEDNKAGSDPERQGFAGGGIYLQRHCWYRIARCAVLNNTVFGWLSFGGGIDADFPGSVEPVIIEDTEIRGNRILSRQGDTTSAAGGASLVAPFILRNCVVAENHAATAAGLNLSDFGDAAEIRNVRVVGNQAAFDWGGISYDYRVLSGLWTVEGLILQGNVAGRDGGGLHDFNGGVVWGNAKFIDNVAGRNGGGVYANGRVDLSRASLTGNHAGGDGGALWVGKAIGLSIAIMTGNNADGRGGALFLNTLDEATTIKGATIVGNSAGTQGGGLHIADDSFIEAPSAVNSIIRNNVPESIVDNSGSLEITRSNVDDVWSGVGNLDVDPRFVDPAGGDFRLGPNSPCIDAGDSRASGASVDVDGLPRRVDDPGMPDSGIGSSRIVDMGAYEFQGASAGFVTVHPRPGIAGRSNSFQAAGAAPGNVVYFVYGFATGSTGVPGCPGLRIEIAGPRIATQAAADAQGNASVNIGVPGAASGRAIVLQAVDHAGCEVSNVVRYRFP